jgi:hypothetical protein
VAWAIENTPSIGTLAGVYVKGIVKANPNVDTGYKNATYYICDLDANGEPANEFYVFRGKNVGNTDFTNVNQLTEGDEVIIYGTLKTYSSVKEFDAGNYIIANGRTAASISSVKVSGDADKTEYFAGETFEYAGLSARAIYNTGYQKNVTPTWKANTEASYIVSTSETINVTATYGGKTSANYPVAVEVTTKVLESIDVTPAALTGYKGVALPKPTTVTAHFDDGGIKSTQNVAALAIYDEAGDYDATSTAEQTIQVKYTFGLNTRTANYTVTLSSIHNSLATAYSVEEARAIINLDQEVGNDLDLANTDNTVWVLGRVTSVETNQIIIKDDADETKILYLWKYDFGAGITSVEVGDLIKAYGNLKLYSAKYELDEDCEIVWKQPKVSIEIENQTMEVDQTLTIADVATIDPALAPVTYSIKAGSDACITLAGGVITATAEGEATIIAHADAYEEYLGNEVEFSVTVHPAAHHTNVVLYAEYDGHYYALNNEATATEIDLFEGKVVVPDEATKNAIVWDRAEREGVATFLNGSKYLKGSTSTTLSVSEGASGSYQWTWKEAGYYTTNASGTIRTFLYRASADNGFMNYAASNKSTSDYADYTVIYTDEILVGTIETVRSVTPGRYGTICMEKNMLAVSGALMFNAVGKDAEKVYLETVAAPYAAGKPYCFLAEADELKAVYGSTTALSPVANGALRGTFVDMYQDAIDDAGSNLYIVSGNMLWQEDGQSDNEIPADRAYLLLNQVPDINVIASPAPGVLLMAMSVNRPT